MSQSIWALKEKKRKEKSSVFSLVNSKSLTQGIQKNMFVFRSDSLLNIQSTEILSEYFQEADLVFLSRYA